MVIMRSFLQKKHFKETFEKTFKTVSKLRFPYKVPY